MMKKLLLILASSTIAFSAFAGEVQSKPAGSENKQQQQQQQQTDAEAIAAANNGGNVNGSSTSGNSQTIIFTGPEKSVSEAKVEYSGTQTLKNVPSVNGPPLTTSNDTCMGSVSASVNVPGFGGSLGKTYTDDNCVMLKNSREFWNMGLKAAAIARLCMDELNKEALEITDFECPQTTKAKQAAAASNGSNVTTAGSVTVSKSTTMAVVRPDLTDPLVRIREGLAPLE